MAELWVMAKSKKSPAPLKPEEEIEKLAARLRQLRKDKGYGNYEFFAYENRIGRSQYGKYEKGADMQFSTIVKLANMHGMTLKEFFGEGFD